MSDMFKNIGGQGASSNRSNTQYWVDYENSAEGQALRAKEKAGTLSAAEQNAVNAMNMFKTKAKAEGVESSKSVSSSTGVPDFTDSAVQARKMAQSLQMLTGRGRKQSFLGGDYSSTSLGGGSMLGGAS